MVNVEEIEEIDTQTSLQGKTWLTLKIDTQTSLQVVDLADRDHFTHFTARTGQNWAS